MLQLRGEGCPWPQGLTPSLLCPPASPMMNLMASSHPPTGSSVPQADRLWRLGWHEYTLPCCTLLLPLKVLTNLIQEALRLSSKHCELWAYCPGPGNLTFLLPVPRPPPPYSPLLQGPQQGCRPLL